MTTKEDLQFEFADIYTQLRLCGFEEQEIVELKLTRRSLSYLKVFLHLAQQMECFKNEDIERQIGVRQ